MQNFDSGKIVADVFSKFLDRRIEDLWTAFSSVYRAARDEVKIQWRSGYETYLIKAYNKHSEAKTLLNPDKARPLKEFYVPLKLKSGAETIPDFENPDDSLIVNLFERPGVNIITATAGSGKSMLMQHLFLETLEKTERIPVLIRLRHISADDGNNNLSVYDLIKKELEINNFDFDGKFLEMALDAGHFAFFLDGFDEIVHAKRSQISQEIQDLSDKYEKCRFIVSSRPDNRLNFNSSTIWKVQPLDEKYARLLIKRTPVEGWLKENFIKKLETGMFDKHGSFLSNPMLLTIMLLTYQSNPRIPQKISVFYENAYTALFYRHSALGGFEHKKLSDLEHPDFKRLFSAFCSLSHRKEDYEFDDELLQSYLEAAATRAGFGFENRQKQSQFLKNYLRDVKDAVCLLVAEGFKTVFAHRAFQEYFTVFDILEQESDKTKKGLFYYFEKEWDENVHLLFYEMKPAIVEKELIIPTLNEVCSANESLTSDERYKHFLKKTLSDIYYDKDIGTTAIKLGDAVLQNCVYAFALKTLLEVKTDSFAPEFENQLKQKHPAQPNQSSLSVPISRILSDESLFQLLAQGNHIYSKQNFDKMFELHKLLAKKQKEIEKRDDIF